MRYVWYDTIFVGQCAGERSRWEFKFRQYRDRDDHDEGRLAMLIDYGMTVIVDCK